VVVVGMAFLLADGALSLSLLFPKINARRSEEVCFDFDDFIVLHFFGFWKKKNLFSFNSLSRSLSLLPCMLVRGRCWASLAHRQGLLSLVSRLGGIESSSSGVEGGGRGGASVSMMADSMAMVTSTSNGNGNGASRRAKSDLSALHNPPLVGE
jgi:hypothetical protein